MSKFIICVESSAKYLASVGTLCLGRCSSLCLILEIKGFEWRRVTALMLFPSSECKEKTEKGHKEKECFKS
jgi:hypothetical protein